MKDLLIYTTHKSASSFIHKLCDGLCEVLGVNYYTVNGSHKEQVREKSWNYFIESPEYSGCFAPIRAGEGLPNIPRDVTNYRIIIHLRDPRDVLTSLYFSHAYSHEKSPGGFNPDETMRRRWQEEGVDRYVLNNLAEYKKRYLDLIYIMDQAPNPILLRYAELIRDFPSWLQKFMAGFNHFALPDRFTKYAMYKERVYAEVHKAVVNRFKDEFAIPEKENVYLHKRQLETGDYLNKLSANTIDVLNKEFEDILFRINTSLDHSYVQQVTGE